MKKSDVVKQKKFIDALNTSNKENFYLLNQKAILSVSLVEGLQVWRSFYKR